MPDFNDWIGTGVFGPNTTARAVRAWNRIRDREALVTIKRGGSTVAAQTVRIEPDTASNEVSGDGGGSSSRQMATVFGVKDHPTVSDTDIQRGDQFAYNAAIYRVVSVVYPPGEVQARCEAVR